MFILVVGRTLFLVVGFLAGFQSQASLSSKRPPTLLTCGFLHLQGNDNASDSSLASNLTDSVTHQR